MKKLILLTLSLPSCYSTNPIYCPEGYTLAKDTLTNQTACFKSPSDVPSNWQPMPQIWVK